MLPRDLVNTGPVCVLLFAEVAMHAISFFQAPFAAQTTSLPWGVLSCALVHLQWSALAPGWTESFALGKALTCVMGRCCGCMMHGDEEHAAVTWLKHTQQHPGSHGCCALETQCPSTALLLLTRYSHLKEYPASTP